MEDTLISFETAKLAKEKKFNAILRKYYYFDGTIGSVNGNANWNCSIESIYSAPTQSLLQKWLRDVHKFFIVIDHSKNDIYSVRLSDWCDNCLSTKLFGESYKSYEEALEVGLYEALKLISL